MAELRRLLIEADRLRDADADGVLALDTTERHYLRRVLRLRPGDPFDVVDGLGHRWTAGLVSGEELRLSQPLAEPIECAPAPSPVLGLAVVGVRRGMDALMRMACELGIDRIQPLHSRWRTPQAEDRPERWQTILKEATEQCERLWRPELLAVKPAAAWWSEPDAAAARALATTRHHTLPSLAAWLNQQQAVGSGQGPKEIWLAIGPEAGWSEDEVLAAGTQGWTTVQLGPSILRTATAAVAAATLMTNWRSMRNP